MTVTHHQPSGMTASVLVPLSGATQGTRTLAEECAVALVFNGSTEAVMMASPTDLEDFGRGFALSEGIVENRAQIEALEVLRQPRGIEVRLRIPDARAQALIQRRRNAFGPVGCGLCGIDSLDQAMRPLAPLPVAQPLFSSAALVQTFDRLRAHQPLHDATRATHAAACLAADGTLRATREDVGRHNALDKLIGAQEVAGHAALITSRVSVDLVQKCVTSGLVVLVSASAPTAEALRTASRNGLTLAQVRGEGLEVFCHPERLIGEV
ncbi:formate dehydrogenase accessory protein [Aquimixticola soesokkakensis]|uniref:Sulfur carrier protein FdhD n=1 Tax=Aquimixticola soesokkakensis TaxID=1519096 RepID=A0A1Y5SXG4_9RHOB|nr:formate dehydrogenase accessory sulfurtransferase FdhD [Aquimixticola soesokkakensis]SLN51143.1 formate dehydrogenase accessory protein [Aquimixticola soesokkakensis]